MLEKNKLHVPQVRVLPRPLPARDRRKIERFRRLSDRWRGFDVAIRRVDVFTQTTPHHQDKLFPAHYLKRGGAA